MDSRLRPNPERLMEVFVEVASPKGNTADPEVIRTYPQDYPDQDVVKTIAKFCFPFDVERVKHGHIGQNFTFVLTDADGKHSFGFCRLSSASRSCVCLLRYSSPVHLTCAPHLCTSPVHLTCAPHLCTSPVHLTCAPHLCTSPVHLTCAPHLCTSPVHLTCAPHLCTSPVHLTCAPHLCTSLVHSRRSYL
ncbi:DENN domain-containing protein 1A-like [Lampetra planeri]